MMNEISSLGMKEVSDIVSTKQNKFNTVFKFFSHFLAHFYIFIHFHSFNQNNTQKQIWIHAKQKME